MRPIVCDLSDWNSTRQALEKAIPVDTPLKYLANVAGIYISDPFEKISENHIDQYVLSAFKFWNIILLCFVIIIMLISYISLFINCRVFAVNVKAIINVSQVLCVFPL